MSKDAKQDQPDESNVETDNPLVTAGGVTLALMAAVCVVIVLVAWIMG